MKPGCQQQVGEAWFADILAAPLRAISMSVRQILKAKEILAVVPRQPQSCRDEAYSSRARSAPCRGVHFAHASERHYLSRHIPLRC